MAKKKTWRPRAARGRGDARGEPGRCADGTPRVSAQRRTGSPSNGRSHEPGLRVPVPSADGVSDHPRVAGSSDGPFRARGCTGQVRSNRVTGDTF